MSLERLNFRSMTIAALTTILGLTQLPRLQRSLQQTPLQQTHLKQSLAPSGRISTPKVNSLREPPSTHAKHIGRDKPSWQLTLTESAFSHFVKPVINHVEYNEAWIKTLSPAIQLMNTVFTRYSLGNTHKLIMLPFVDASKSAGTLKNPASSPESLNQPKEKTPDQIKVHHFSTNHSAAPNQQNHIILVPGGGIITGPSSHYSLAHQLAKDFDVWMLEYTKFTDSPNHLKLHSSEHSLPALNLKELNTLNRYLTEDLKIPEEQIAYWGDSAGGAIVNAYHHQRAEANNPICSPIALISPADSCAINQFHKAHDLREMLNNDMLLCADAILNYANAYPAHCEGRDQRNLEAPVLMTRSAGEVLEGPINDLYEDIRVRTKNSDVTLLAYTRVDDTKQTQPLPHAFPIFTHVPEYNAALTSDILSWYHKQIGIQGDCSALN